MSPTKQAKSQGNSGNEPKQKPWENPGSVGGQLQNKLDGNIKSICPFPSVWKWK